MIVTRGLGHPGNLIASGGLGRVVYVTPTGDTYIYTDTGWQLVETIFVHDGSGWVEAPEVFSRQGAGWVQIWG